MGLLLSYFGYYGRTDDPDPVTGLTSREKYLIQSNWAIVRKDLTNVGVQLLHTFFTQYPEYLAYFPAFKGAKLDKIAQNKKFRAHSANVMYALTSLIENLNDNDVLLNLIARLGESHGRRKIPEKAILDIKSAAMESVGNYLGSKLTPEAAAAFDKVVDVALKGIVSNLKSDG